MDKLLIFISILMSMGNMFFISLSIPPNIIYGWFGVLGCITMLYGVKINVTTLLLIVACVFSIISNDIPAIFQSESRLFSFCMMLWVIGPLNESIGSLNFKWGFWRNINKIIVIGTVISFIGYLFHFPLFYGSHGFNGFTNHSMTLSSLAGISFLICLHLFFKEKEDRQTLSKKKWIFLCSSLFSILVCFIGASRGALIATFVGVFFYLWFYFSNIVRFFKYLLVSLIFIVILSPIWYPYTENVREKTEQREEAGGQFSSRESKWTARIDEFCSSPMFGVGFASIDYQKHSDEVRSNGGIEPGSSWLFALSSVGMFGFFFLVILIMRPIILYCIDPFSYSINSLLVISLLVWRVVHLFIEGYIMAAGDFSFLYTWLLVAFSNDIVKNKYVINNRVI